MDCIRQNADDLIAHYLTHDLPPSDYRVLFAAILMQAKRDLQYTGTIETHLGYQRDAKRWVKMMTDPAGITFGMCCEALNLDEGAAKRYL